MSSPWTKYASSWRALSVECCCSVASMCYTHTAWNHVFLFHRACMCEMSCAVLWGVTFFVSQTSDTVRLLGLCVCVCVCVSCRLLPLSCTDSLYVVLCGFYLLFVSDIWYGYVLCVCPWAASFWVGFCHLQPAVLCTCLLCSAICHRSVAVCGSVLFNMFLATSDVGLCVVVSRLLICGWVGLCVWSTSTWCSFMSSTWGQSLRGQLSDYTKN